MSGFNKYKRKWNGGNKDGSSMSLDNNKEGGNGAANKGGNRWKSNNNDYNNNNNNNNNNKDSDSGPVLPESIFELGKNKRVTVRQFRNVNLIDIREYYKDSSNGELKPGKKGISLTEEMYDSLIRQRRNIEDALKRLGSKRTKNGLLDSIRDQDANGSKSQEDGTTNKDTAAEGSLLQSNEDSNSKKRSLEASGVAAASAAASASATTTGTESHGGSSDLKKVKQEIAPPQLLPNEAAKRQEELETQTSIVTPGMHNQQQPQPPKLVKNEPTDDTNLNSSDEEFAAGLEADIKGN